MIKYLKIAILGLLWLCANSCLAQDLFTGNEPLFTDPKKYTTYFTTQAPQLDGTITEAAWQAAPWTENFTDIEGGGKPKPTWPTRVKMLWNDTCLFLAAELQEPHVWATLKERDAIIYHDNDFEVFLDPDNDGQHYYEIEVNALNTIFDLYLDKPYRNGGQALISWRAAGLQSAVQVQGTINQPNDIDKSWTVEMAIPFRAISKSPKSKMPVEGDFWRINFSRVQWDTVVKDGKYVKVMDRKGKLKPEHNWVWSPQGVINMHFPERWGYLFFSRQTSASKQDSLFTLPPAEKLKKYLWYIYYQQKDYYRQHQQYAASLNQLTTNANQPIQIDPILNKVKLEVTTHQFMAYITGPDTITWTVNQDGRIQNTATK